MNIKELMAKEVPVCKICGLSHNHYRAANTCCQSTKRRNKL